MENREELQDQLGAIEVQLDDIVDEMIEKYGKFYTVMDIKDGDQYKANLARQFSDLTRRKEQIIDKLNDVHTGLFF
jgi:hypothetical protein